MVTLYEEIVKVQAVLKGDDSEQREITVTADVIEPML